MFLVFITPVAQSECMYVCSRMLTDQIMKRSLFVMSIVMCLSFIIFLLRLLRMNLLRNASNTPPLLVEILDSNLCSTIVTTSIIWMQLRNKIIRKWTEGRKNNTVTLIPIDFNYILQF